MIQNTRAVTFGYYAYTDIGAGPSVKIAVVGKDKTNKNFEVKSYMAGKVFPEGKLLTNKQTAGDEFAQALTHRYTQAITAAKPTLAPNDKQLEGIVITTAGAPTPKGVIPVMSNAKLDLASEKNLPLEQKSSIKNIPLFKLPNLLTEKQVALSSQQTFKFSAYNDMGGGTAYARHVLKNDIKPGETWTYFMAGTGLGVSKIAHNKLDNTTTLEFSEAGHTPIAPADTKTGEVQTIESHGASAIGLTRIFTDELKEKDKAIPQTVLDQIKNDKNSVIITNEATYTEFLKKNNINTFDKDAYKQAATKAIKTYVGMLGRAIATHTIANNATGAILGQTNQLSGVMTYVNDNHKTFEPLVNKYREKTEHMQGALLPKDQNNFFMQLLLSSISAYLDSGLHPLSLNGQFKLRTVPLNDNTVGGPYLLDGESIDNKNARIRIPDKAFNQRPITLPDKPQPFSSAV